MEELAIEGATLVFAFLAVEGALFAILHTLIRVGSSETETRRPD